MQEEVLTHSDLMSVHENSAFSANFLKNVLRGCQVSNPSSMPAVAILVFLMFLSDEAEIDGVIGWLVTISDNFDLDNELAFLNQRNCGGCLAVTIIQEGKLLSGERVLFD
jgi:cytochrome b